MAVRLQPMGVVEQPRARVWPVQAVLLPQPRGQVEAGLAGWTGPGGQQKQPSLSCPLLGQPRPPVPFPSSKDSRCPRESRHLRPLKATWYGGARPRRPAPAPGGNQFLPQGGSGHMPPSLAHWASGLPPAQAQAGPSGGQSHSPCQCPPSLDLSRQALLLRGGPWAGLLWAGRAGRGHGGLASALLVAYTLGCEALGRVTAQPWGSGLARQLECGVDLAWGPDSVPGKPVCPRTSIHPRPPQTLWRPSLLSRASGLTAPAWWGAAPRPHP